MKTFSRDDIRLDKEFCSHCTKLMDTRQEFERKIRTVNKINRLTEIIRISECLDCKNLNVILYCNFVNVEDESELIWDNMHDVKFDVDARRRYKRELLHSSDEIKFIRDSFELADIN